MALDRRSARSKTVPRRASEARSAALLELTVGSASTNGGFEREPAEAWLGSLASALGRCFDVLREIVREIVRRLRPHRRHEKPGGPGDTPQPPVTRPAARRSCDRRCTCRPAEPREQGDPVDPAEREGAPENAPGHTASRGEPDSRLRIPLLYTPLLHPCAAVAILGSATRAAVDRLSNARHRLERLVPGVFTTIADVLTTLRRARAGGSGLDSHAGFGAGPDGRARAGRAPQVLEHYPTRPPGRVEASLVAANGGEPVPRARQDTRIRFSGPPAWRGSRPALVPRVASGSFGPTWEKVEAQLDVAECVSAGPIRCARGRAAPVGSVGIEIDPKSSLSAEPPAGRTSEPGIGRSARHLCATDFVWRPVDGASSPPAMVGEAGPEGGSNRVGSAVRGAAQHDVESAGAAVGAPGLRPAQHPSGEPGLLEPVRHRPAKDPAAPLSPAGDHEHAAMAAGLGLGEKGHEGVVRRLLVEPVQVEPGGNRVESTLEPAQGPPVEGSRGGWSRWRAGCSATTPGGNLGGRLRFAGRRSLGGLDRGGERGKRWGGIFPAGPLDAPDDLANGVVPERQLEGGRNARAATHQRFDP